ncbi:MAG: heparinase II/III family protein [Planctomycetes bacterium]|nr:heparinase II/III family protein [Planctomycetota bacterium]
MRVSLPAAAALLFLSTAALADPAHPRVFLRAEAWADGPSLPEIRKKAKLRPWSDRLGELKETTHGKALHWRLTGDEASAQACLDALKGMSADEGYGLSALGPVLELPVAYDWLSGWKKFGVAERKMVEEKIVKTADSCVEFLKGNGDSVWHTSAPRSLMGVALAGAALDGAKGAEYAKFAREYFETVYAPAMAALDGGAVAGMSYGVAEGFQPLGYALWAMKSAQGYDGFGWAKERGNWLEGRLEYMALLAAPDGTWPRWGDCVGGSRASMKEEVRCTVDMLALGTGAPVGAWLSRRIAAAFPGNAGYHACVLPDLFVFGREWADPGAYEPPRTRLFGRATIGQAAFRTGWDDAATAVFFKAGDYFDNHGHFDQGSFTIYRRGWLALDSGSYGGFNAPHRMEYLRKTVAHNAIVMGKDADGGQRIVNRQDFQDLGDWEKKKRSNQLETGDIVGWESGEGWTWVAADLRAAYDPKLVGWFWRELVWLDSGVLIVYDRLVTKSPPRWLLHVTPEPSIDGKTFTATLGESKLWGKTLLPENAAPRAVGPGCLVDGKDFPPDAPGSYSVPGAWRIEVSGLHEFLHVLAPLDAKTDPPEAVLVREGGRAGVEIEGKKFFFQARGDVPKAPASK